MTIVQQTETFSKWFNALKDEVAKAHIVRRIRRIETEDFFGDCEPVGKKTSRGELKWLKKK